MSESPYEPLERRPIESRNTKWAEAVTRFLVKSNASPNGISLFGMIAAIGAGVAFMATAHFDDTISRILWFLGGLFCQIRLLCNLFDGMVAVERGIASRIGEIYNEVPDRVSDAAVMIGLGYAAGGNSELGYLAACFAIFVAYVRAMSKSIGAPNDFCGPMAKPQRMALVTLLSVYMAFSPASWRTSFGEATLVLILIVVGCLITAARRLTRAAIYLKQTV